MSVLIIGASLAGLSAAETLRSSGYNDEIVVVDGWDSLPSDRPPLSKQVLAGEWPPEKAAQRAAAHLHEWELDLRLGLAATSIQVDPDSQRPGRVALSDGTVIEPDGLIIATGSRPRHVTDQHIDGVHLLRNLEDSLTLRDDLEATDGPVVVIGAGFIGAEVAATCRSLGRDVTLIEAAPSPLMRVFPQAIGDFVADLHRANGADVRLGVGVAELECDSSGRITGVRMSDGSLVEAAVVVVGIGVIPNVEWLADSPLRLDNGIHCDDTCLAAPGVVAAGDVASWYNPRYRRQMRVEQWEHAIQQGEYAAKRILVEMGFGDTDMQALGAFDPVPWFWSDQYGKKIQMAGFPDAGDEMVLVEGSFAEGRFAVLFRRGDECSAVLGVNRPRHVMQARMKLEASLDWDGVISLFR